MSLVQAILARFDAHSTSRLQALVDLAVLDSTITALATAAGPVGPGNAESEHWEAIFDAVFGGTIEDEQRRVFANLSLTFPDYHDPDTTYGEDAMAWIAAFRSIAEPVLRSIDTNRTVDEHLAAVAVELDDIMRRIERSNRGAIARYYVKQARVAVETLAIA